MQLVPRLEAGGAERSTLEIADALVRAGHRAIVVSAGGRWVERLTAFGGEHVALDLGRKSLATLWKAGALARLIERERPDVLHARSRLPAWMAVLALRRARHRPHFVTTVHGLNSPGRYSRVMVSGERAICVSDSVRDYVQRHYPDVPAARLVTIPRGVDRDAFPYGYQPDGAWRERFYADFPALRGRPFLLLPARGTRLKGHHDAIRVLTKLRGTHGIDAALLLLGAREAGREAYVAELDALARALGVSARVVIAAPRNDVREVMAIAAAVLQLSNKPEAFGRTVVEAVSLGVPVIGYAHGGVGELLAELYPQGAVARDDLEAAAARARAAIEAPVPVAETGAYALADMQSATLALYAALADP